MEAKWEAWPPGCWIVCFDKTTDYGCDDCVLDGDAVFRRDHVPACPECEGAGGGPESEPKPIGGIAGTMTVRITCRKCGGSGRSTWEEYDGRNAAPC